MTGWKSILDLAAEHAPRSLQEGVGEEAPGGLVRLLPETAHPYYEACVCIEGRSAVAGSDTHVPLESGRSCIVFPDTLHSESTIAGQPAFTDLWLIFSEETSVVRSEYDPASGRFGSAPLGRLGSSPEAFRLLSGLKAAITRAADALVVKGLWLELLGRVRETPALAGGASRSHIERQVRFTMARMHAAPKHPWHVRELAGMVGWTANHYSLRFRQVVGQSPMDYLIAYRLERAARLVGSTSMNIAEVGYETGFNSASYFARRFKHVYGVTPRAYREEHAG